MSQQFVNRDSELDFLEKHYNSKEAEMIVIYGRRRIGKTELIQKFLENKRAIYFFGRQESASDFWKRINLHLTKCFNDFSLIEQPVNTFDLFFDYLYRKTKDERIIFVFDEFPFIFERFPEAISALQDYWDRCFKDSGLFMILCGSSISMMENKVLSSKSPLYGRRTGQWNVKPFSVFDLKKMFTRYNMKEIIELYGLLDGIPGYVVKFDDKEKIPVNIKKRILSKGEFLYEEIENLLREEFRDVSNYMSIIKSIAGGYTTFNEIYVNTNFDKSLISKYLFILENLHIVIKEFPVLFKANDRLKGRGHYILSDNFFNFWFKFIWPNKECIEEGRTEDAYKIIEKDFNSYMGFVFEKAARQLIIRDKPFNFTKIGRQWGKIPKLPKGQNTYEIDFVALDEDSKSIGFFECKWKDLSFKQSLKILEDLKQKAKYVRWGDDSRAEKFGLIAKRIEGKDKLRAEGFLVFDLADFE